MSQRAFWETQWSRADFQAPWLGRGVSPEIVEAAANGWFPAGAPALDIGCGQGEVAAWLADHGFPTVGIDIAPSAIARALGRFGDQPGRLEFAAVDVCRETPPDRQYRVLIDRGCLHQIPAPDAPRYVDTITAVSAPDARMLLFVKAFRGAVPRGDTAEWRRVSGEVERIMSGAFDIVRRHATFLDPFDGRDEARALPGIVFWLVRRGEAGPVVTDAR